MYQLQHLDQIQYTLQTFSVVTQNTIVRLFTSVPYPYPLFLHDDADSVSASFGYSVSAPREVNDPRYQFGNASRLCEQVWETVVTSLSDAFVIQPTLTFSFNQGCSSTFERDQDKIHMYLSIHNEIIVNLN